MKIISHILKAIRKIKTFCSKFWTLWHENGFRCAMSFLFSSIDWKLRTKKAVAYEMRHPAKVREDRIVFEAYGDYGDNSRVLFEYMIRKGYLQKYEMVWLVDQPEKYLNLIPQEVQVIRRRLPNGKISLEAIRAVHSAKYVFYTVAVNWAKIAQKEQVFINLWHGCSFKANKGDRKVFFDYCLITSPFFMKLKKEFWHCRDDQLLSIGYPRYDLMKSGDKDTASVVKQILDEHKCDKMILWMPTYRKSKSERLNEDTLSSSVFNLPIVKTQKELDRLNNCCRENRVLLVIKKHKLHMLGSVKTIEHENILYIDNDWLDKKNIQLYALLHEADALITDYSSVGIDYMLMDRPIGFTLDDYEMYRESRGFTIEDPIEYMPGRHIYNPDDYEEFILEICNNQDPYREKRREVTKMLHVENDSYCQSLLDLFRI